MANLKISQLTSAGALAGTEVLPIVQSGTTVKTTVQDIVDLSAPVVMPTYQDFYNLLIAEALVPGTKYEVPYRSVNWLNGYTLASSNPTPIDPSFNPREIHVGPEEILIVEATSTYEVATISYSKEYMMDIVGYLPYTNKIGLPLSVFNGETLPDSSVVSGFDLQWDGTNVYFNMPAGYPAYYGQILYLYAEFDGGAYAQDGAFEPLLPNTYAQFAYSTDVVFDGYPKQLSRIRLLNNGYKVVLLDLTETDYNNYEPDSLYIDHIVAEGDAYGWVLRRQSTDLRVDVPFDFRAVTYRRYEIDTTLVVPAAWSTGFKYIGIGDNWNGAGTTGNYVDMLSMPEFYWDRYDITILGIGGPRADWYAGSYENNVFFTAVRLFNISMRFMYNNTFVGEVYNIDLACTQFNSNTFFEFRYSSGSVLILFNNIFYQIQTCVFSKAANIQNNKIFLFTHNQINAQFSQTYVYFFTYNTVNFLFIGITNTDCRIVNNIINGECNSFNLDPTQVFQNNFIKNNLTSPNFLLATHVYGTYPCDIFNNSAGVIRLSYVNASDVLTVVAPTA